MRFLLLLFLVSFFSFSQSFDKNLERSITGFSSVASKYEKSRKSGDLIKLQKKLEEVFLGLEKYVEGHGYVERQVLVRYCLKRLFNTFSFNKTSEIQQIFYQTLENTKLKDRVKSDIYFVLYDIFSSKSEQVDEHFLLKKAYELDKSSVEKRFFYGRDILYINPEEGVKLLEEIINDPYIYGDTDMLYNAFVTLASYFEGRDSLQAIKYYEAVSKMAVLKGDEKIKVAQSLLKLYADNGSYKKVSKVAKKVYDLTKIQDFLEVYCISNYVSSEKVSSNEKEKLMTLSSKNPGRKLALESIVAYEKGNKERAVGLAMSLENNDGLRTIGHLLLFKFTLLERLEKENEDSFLKLVDYFRGVRNNEGIADLLDRRKNSFTEVDIDDYVRSLLAFSKQDSEAGLNYLNTALDKGGSRIERAMKGVDFYSFLSVPKKDLVVDILKKITRTKHSNLEGLQALSILYEEKKDYKKQLSILKKISEEGDDSADVVYSFVRVYDRLADIKNMQVYFDKLIKNYPLHAEYYNYYAYSMIERDQNLAKAMKAVETALKFDPENVFYLDTYAWGYYFQKNYDKANEIMSGILTKLDEKNPDNGEFYYHAGRIANALKDTENEKKYSELSKKLGYVHEKPISGEKKRQSSKLKK